MMGPHHAACGAAGWVAVSSTAVGFGWLPWGPAGFGIGVIAAAGAALLPDLDHPNASAARGLPPVTTGLAALTASLSGGHRHGTHSLLGAAVFTAAAWGSGHLTATGGGGHTIAWGAGLWILLLAGLGLGALHLTRRTVTWPAAALLAAIAAATSGDHPGWLAVTVAVGVVAHLAGDLLTTAGIPILWPWTPTPPRQARKSAATTTLWHRNGWIALPILGDAGSARETLICAPIWGYAIIGGGYTLWAALPT